VALRDLVDALNARAGAGRYAVVPAPEGGTGSDATRVALIHPPARVTAVGRAAADIAAVHERAPLAQAFQVAGGGRLLVVVGHLKSKRCDGAVGADADRGDGQGCFNERRVRQAEALQRFALGLRERAGTTDVLLLGDFNAHAREDPVRHLTEAGRWHDLLARWAPAAYTHVFDGVASRLDAAFASPSLASQVAGAAVWHINADESPPPAAAEPDGKGGALAFRSSDHDPVVIGIHLRSKSHPPLSRAGASPWKVPVRADTSGHAARPPP
jgi:predicted extracellular nuclease